jgi:hypothetical protein
MIFTALGLRTASRKLPGAICSRKWPSRALATSVHCDVTEGYPDITPSEPGTRAGALVLILLVAPAEFRVRPTRGGRFSLGGSPKYQFGLLTLPP